MLGARHLRAGRFGEKFARGWLEKKALTFVQANFRCRCGELDLIMLEHSCLVVIEVRYRANDGYGGAIASIGRAKQHRIALATRYFLQQNPRWSTFALRFDVLALSGYPPQLQADWRQRAFEFDDL